MNEDLMKKIVAEVISQMSDAKAAPAAEKAAECTCCEDEFVPDVSVGDHIETYNVENPANAGAFLKLKRASPARLGIGNTGARYLTRSALRFEADFATAVDAFRYELPHAFVEELGMFEVKTLCENKDDFILFPDKGRKLDDAGVAAIREKCRKKPQVQIIISDGHAANAIEANIKAVLPTLVEGLKAEGISVGDPFFVRFGRVAIEDEVGELTGAEVVVDLIGERPALAASDSMSAYIAYKPTVGMSESNRTVVSNISKQGTPPAEAGAHIVDLVKLILEKKVTGTELAQMM
ncbi:MAG: ethanolamine ammonia-lyase subunit EutC [Butyricicoccus sp.]|nr:ethanolamine ammonia-lyase subunit EutC [Butyricicoccus sp.]